MKRVDYDRLASTYDGRYTRYRWDETETCLREFVRGGARRVAEVGCGTGHWLAALADVPGRTIGIDASGAMLERARASVPAALLVRGTAVALPLADASVDRLFCVHALHHFPSAAAFIRECRRVLRPGGGFCNIGLDPHTGLDRWWIYDYFPGTLDLDRRRYTSASQIGTSLADAGFHDVRTTLVHHIRAALTVSDAEASGALDRRAASQLVLLSDREYDSGVDRIRREQPVLQSDMRVFATIGWVGK